MLRKIGLVLLSFILLGCSRESPEIIAVNSPSPINTLLVSTSEFISDPSQTPSETQTEPASATSTLTPIPTISDQNQFVEYVSFTGNNECMLPCLVGITPGQTSWEEAIHSVAPFESVADVRKHMGIENSPMGSENALSVYYLSDNISVNLSIGSNKSNEDMLVNSILMTFVAYDNKERESGWRLMRRYKLDMKSLFFEYGMPEFVFLSTDFGVPEFPEVNITSLFVYPDYQFVIEYPRRGIVDGDRLISCEPSDHFLLTIVDNVEKINSIEALASTLETKQLNIEYWTPYEEVTDVPIDAYYEDYILSSIGCFSFPIDAWQFMLDN